MTDKQIWHPWDGQSPIPANAVRYIDRNGRHHIPRFTIPFKHSGFGAGGEIVAYTLGETRERVECEDCGGKGKRKLTDFVSKVGFSGVCICCQGRGYIWKTEVAK